MLKMNQSEVILLFFLLFLLKILLVKFHRFNFILDGLISFSISAEVNLNVPHINNLSLKSINQVVHASQHNIFFEQTASSRSYSIFNIGKNMTWIGKWVSKLLQSYQFSFYLVLDDLSFIYDLDILIFYFWDHTF